MTDPKTLMQMAGADMTPSALSAASLVLIDCQLEYVDGKLPLHGCAEALDEVAKLLARARAANTPIFHIQHHGQPGGLFDVEGHGGQIAAQAAPEGEEPILRKTLPNAFTGTDLAEVLEAAGRKEVIFAGFMTHMCVSSTARNALDRGYRSTVVADAVATRDLPLPGGGTIAAAQLHETALAELSDRFAIIAPSTSALPD